MMKKHLTERVTSSSWLGMLAFLFVSSLSPLNSKSNLFLFSGIVLSIFFIVFGYFRGYKILLLPADHLNTFPLRCISGVWLGSLIYFMVLVINSFIFDQYTQTKIMILIGITVFAFIIGWLYLYRVLLFPKVRYLKLFPSIIQRMICKQKSNDTEPYCRSIYLRDRCYFFANILSVFKTMGL